MYRFVLFLLIAVLHGNCQSTQKNNCMKHIFSLSLVLFSAFVTNNLFALTNTFPTKAHDWGTISVSASPEHQFKNTFSAYANLAGISLDKCGAIVYVAPHDGEFKLISNQVKEDLEVVVFRAETINFSNELSSESAFLLSHVKLQKGQTFSADMSNQKEAHEKSRFQILKGQAILVFVISSQVTSVDFTPELKKVKDLEARKKVETFEFRKNKAGKALRIAVRDAKTGLPVKARVNISGLKGLENVFNGSDLTFDLVTGKNALISCDAEGYFKNDVTPKFIPNEDNVLTVLLNSFDTNENWRLDGVQFKEGTAEPLPTAFKDMDKLFDFLVSNPSIKIEVQGHVNAPDKGSRAAEKLSLMRAKYVRDYLVNKGISSNRIEYEGYGNTMMIYENPKNEIEEQANRRVEIKIFD